MSLSLSLSLEGSQHLSVIFKTTAHGIQVYMQEQTVSDRLENTVEHLADILAKELVETKIKVKESEYCPV